MTRACKEENDGADSYGVKLHAHYERRLGVEVIWQIPPNPNAVLFIAAGRESYPRDFWDPTPGCAHCSGLPEERAITLASLRRGFAVISIASSGTLWMKRPLATNRDLYNVASILSSWRKEHKLGDLPVTGLGISDGGSFLCILALEMKLSAIVLMISRGNEDAIRTAIQNFTCPPILFIEMPADKETSAMIAKHQRTLSEAGIANAKIQCKPLPIHDAFFSERIPNLDMHTSVRIVRSLKEQKYLDSEGYIMRPSLKSASWELAKSWDWSLVIESLNVLPRAASSSWAQALKEEMDLAFAFHTPTSLKNAEMLDWLCGNLT